MASANKAGHSTEYALLEVKNNIHCSLAKSECEITIIIDLSAAFDTIDYGILLYRVCSVYGINGSVLEWFRSYLSQPIQCVKTEDTLSNAQPLDFGVPQGSVLGPILFTIYTGEFSISCRIWIKELYSRSSRGRSTEMQLLCFLG